MGGAGGYASHGNLSSPHLVPNRIPRNPRKHRCFIGLDCPLACFRMAALPTCWGVRERVIHRVGGFYGGGDAKWGGHANVWDLDGCAFHAKACGAIGEIER